MTTRELLYVKTAAEEKSISRAAKKLFVAQPSLSQALQRIEDSIGARLFVRGHLRHHESSRRDFTTAISAGIYRKVPGNHL